MGCVRYSGCMYVRVSPPPLAAAVVVAVPATATAPVTSLVVRSEWELSARARDRGSGHTLVRDTRSPCCQRRQKSTIGAGIVWARLGARYIYAVLQNVMRLPRTATTTHDRLWKKYTTVSKLSHS